MSIPSFIKLIIVAFTPLSGKTDRPKRKRRGLSRLPWLALALLLMSSGCMNLYTRCPWTDCSIDYCYQSTDTMGMVTILSAFPQAASLSRDCKGLEWYNILTVPLFGVPCLVDTACEAALDTILWPVDYLKVNNR